MKNLISGCSFKRRFAAGVYSMEQVDVGHWTDSEVARRISCATAHGA